MTCYITHAYCDECMEIVKVDIDPNETANSSMEYVGRDIVCSECRIIIATIFRKNDEATGEKNED